MLIRGPGFENKIEETPVTLVDLAPTILLIANTEIPNDMDGKSFAKFAMNENVEEEARYTFVEYHGEGQPEYIDDGCPYSEDLSVSFEAFFFSF